MMMGRSRFVVEDEKSASVRTARKESLQRRVRAAHRLLAACEVCPRRCGVNRLADQIGACRIGRLARISSAFAHVGEEDCLRGRYGSGTVFFAGCNLRCVFCQNHEISQSGNGRECTPGDLAEIMLSLQRAGCHNINLVTPEHVVPQVIEAIDAALGCGLAIPIVYNTSGYDSMTSLRELDGLIDIYMPDFKMWSPQVCEEYLGVRDYAKHARNALREMHRQVGDLYFGPDGVARRGLLVRHLVMPGLLEETRRIVMWLAHEVSVDTFVNIMGQYRPDYLVGRVDEIGATRYPGIDRSPDWGELEQAFRIARQAGLSRFA